MQKQQHGFTLIELLIAMLIFAMLALSGWQIMDALSKSRERAKIQIEQLSDLQYAYLQMSQDFFHVSNYVAMPTGISSKNDGLDNIEPKPTFVLNHEQIQLVRFASFDPRFNPSPTFAKVRYLVQDDKLIKERSYQLTNDSQPSRSVILSNVKDVKWQAWSATPMPELVNEFPDDKTLQFATQQNPNESVLRENPFDTQKINQSNLDKPNNDSKKFDIVPYQQLPKGITIRFTYQEQPIVWQFALTDKPPTFVVEKVEANR